MGYDPLLQQPTHGAAPPLVVSTATLTLANGANTDIAQQGTVVFIIGPTGAFSIASVKSAISDTAPIRGGTLVTLYNTTAQNMTITNESGAGTAGFRIHTSTGADLVTTGSGYVTLVYDVTLSRWRDIAFGA